MNPSLSHLLKHTSEWLRGTGPHGDIVMSSRIRLARNLKSYPFSHWASKRQEKEIMRQTEDVIEKMVEMRNAIQTHIHEISDVDRQFLLERHLISREHILRPEFKSVIISDREVASIMVNEEDHLRLQIMRSGFDLQECWRLADKMDTELSKSLDFAFDPNWGFLTACPTNTGTGMRSSVMLHLPALVMTKQINRVIQAITKLGMTARGLYGEGTEAEGNFFQISNQITMGQSEIDTIDSIERMIRQIIGHEEAARKNLLKQNRDMLRDKIFRSYGTLTNAYVISSKETIQHLSMVRLGVDIGLLDKINRRVVNELFILTQPGHLQKLENRMLTQGQRDIKRAEIIRKRLDVK